MAEGERIVILGAGQAGGRAAEALRKAGFAGAVTLVGEESELPYERPPLSKAVLLGQKPPESTRILPPAYYAEHRIELLTGTRAVGLDAKAAEVELADGRRLAYDKLILTTGGRVRVLKGAAPGSPGVHYLRTLAESGTLGRALGHAKTLAVIGGGFLGLEIASSAAKLGLKVVVIEAMTQLLDRVMARDIAERIGRLHRSKGVEIRLGTGVVEIGGAGPTRELQLADGSRIEAELVVVAIGIVPNVELAQAAGIQVANGIAVDQFGETSTPGVYAAGDVAYHPNPILARSLRLESWQNAQNQAIAVARGIAGTPQSYAEVPWFWSDQHGINIQMVGAPARTDKVVWRGALEDGRAIAFNLAEGVVVGATAFNMGGEIRWVRQLIEAQRRIDAGTLADPNQKLRDLLGTML